MSTSSFLRPRSMSGILDTTFGLYRQYFIPFVLVSALSQVPLGIFQIWSQATLSHHLGALISVFNQRSILPSDLLEAFRYLITIGIFFLGITVGTAITQAALTNSTIQSINHERPVIVQAYRLALRQYLTVIVTTVILFFTQVAAVLFLVMGLALFMIAVTMRISLTPTTTWLLLLGGCGMIVILILTTLFLGARLLLTVPIAVIERPRIIKSMARSWSLTRGSFWRSLGFLVAVNLCYYACMILPANIVLYSFNHQTIAIIVRYISLSIAVPIVSIAYTLFYYDVRIRKEGYDLDLQVQQLSAIAQS